MLLFLQGSDGGVMVACVTLWICFWSSRKKNRTLGAVACPVVRSLRWNVIVGKGDAIPGNL